MTSEQAPTSKPAEDKPGFESSIRRLSSIVEQLERGDLPLEQALSLFEDGIKLVRASQAELDQAEKKVEELLSVSEDGSAKTRDLPST
jgi:exodeoxyribonuclease VII small subunit